MTTFEQKELNLLRELLDTTPSCTELWSKAYDRYCELCAKEQEEYKANNIDTLKKFYDEHIAGKEWAEIDRDDWDWYSDYHKDVFGYRPKTLDFPR